MTDNTELKRLAQRVVDIEALDGAEPIGSAWDEFEAAATPAAVLALIAESARLQSAVKTLECLGYRDNGGELWKPPLGQKPDFSLMDQLKAENEALRRERDARHPFKPFHEPAIGFTGCVICGVYTDHGGLPCPKTRATADAAMGRGEQSKGGLQRDRKSAESIDTEGSEGGLQ